MLNFDKDVVTQRYDNVLGLLLASFQGKELSDYQWYRTSDSTALEGQVSSNLNFYDIPYGGNINDAYYVCFTINKGKSDEVKTCACAKKFDENKLTPDFEVDMTETTVTATYAWKGEKVFVNADWQGKTDIECYAQWYDVSGHPVMDKFIVPDGGRTIDTPDTDGLYLLRVVTGNSARSFKFIINH